MIWRQGTSGCCAINPSDSGGDLLDHLDQM